MQDGAVPADWFARHISAMDRTDGDIDTLSNRIAQVRTWTFVANRPDWLKDPEHWQGVARQVEDKLSDALHERLAQRFVDRRTSVLMRRLRENAMLEAEITAAGDVTVEGQHVGHLHGFHFVPDPQADPAEAKTLRNAAAKALAGEIEARAERFSAAADASLVLSNDGTIRWQGDPVAKLEPGDKLYEPRLRILADEQLTGPARDKVETRLRAWLKAHVVRLLGPALQLEEHAELHGPRPRHRLPDRRGARRARALEGAAGGAQPRPGRPRGPAQARRPLRRLPPLPAGAPQAGAAHPRGPALGAEARRPRPAGARRDRASRRLRPHLDPGRPGDRAGPLPGRGLPGLRRARGARRHPGAARGPDPPGDRLPARRDPGRAARRRRGRRGLRRHGRDDLPRRLRRRGFRLDPALARLRVESRPGPAITVPLVPAPTLVAPPAPAAADARRDDRCSRDGRRPGGGDAARRRLLRPRRVDADARQRPPRTGAGGRRRRARRRPPPKPRRRRSRREAAPVAGTGAQAAAGRRELGGGGRRSAPSSSRPPCDSRARGCCGIHRRGGRARSGRRRTRPAVPTAPAAAEPVLDRGLAPRPAPACGRPCPPRPRPGRTAASAGRTRRPRPERPARRAPAVSEPAGPASGPAAPPSAGRTGGRRAARAGAPSKAARRAVRGADERRGPRAGAPLRGAPREAARPESPFAKLLALKAQLEDPNGSKR